MQAMERPNHITYPDIVALCPQVARIISSANPGSRYPWNEYTRCKAELSRIVGWGALADADPRLRTSAAYEAALNALAARMRV